MGHVVCIEAGTVPGVLDHAVSAASGGGPQAADAVWPQTRPARTAVPTKPRNLVLQGEEMMIEGKDQGVLPGSGNWSDAEVRATVDDYLAMLSAEITGQQYSKTEHRAH